jgi:hypothetical protein
MTVYQLHAVGPDGMSGSRERCIYSTTVFRTHEAADRRTETFRQTCIHNGMLAEPIEVAVEPLEVIDE